MTATIEAVWRAEATRVMAGLVRQTRDLADAEELAQEALIRALETWPEDGIPDNPAGWLLRTANNRAVDRWRRSESGGNAMRRLAQTVDGDHDGGINDLINTLNNPFADETLQMLFTACHPALNRDYRAAMTLRCVAGLRTEEIARAYLLPETVIGQRISRAKKVLRDKRIRLDTPTQDQIATRAGTVLEVIYLMFNEGYSPLAGDSWTRPELIHEALRLGRLVARLLEPIPEAHGLLALMELTTARSPARLGPDGAPVLLQHQDRTRWDRTLMRRGLSSLARAQSLGSPVGAYTLQAAIAAEHMLAPNAEEADDTRIAGLYDLLLVALPTPVVQLNRAVARGRADGPEAGLALIDEIEPSALRHYAHLPAARGELLAMAGHHDEAATEFRNAIRLSKNTSEQALFRTRLTSLPLANQEDTTRPTDTP